MALRSFLFLDTTTLADYLAALEGSVAQGEISQTESEKKGKGGKLGFKALDVSGSTERTIESKQTFVMNDAAKFQRLYEMLDEQGDIQHLEAFDEAIWNQLRRNEILEVQAIIQLPKSFMITQVVEQFAPLAEVMRVFGQEPFSTPQEQLSFEGVRSIVKLSENKPVPVLFEATLTQGFRFAANLSRQHLRCDLSDLAGEATVFGKIQRIVPKGQSYEAFSLVSGITSSPILPKNKRQQQQMQREMAQKNIADIVRGPAIILSPVAVYR